MFDIVPLSPEDLFRKASQEELFSFYLRRPARPGGRYCNPARNDRNPSCTLLSSTDGHLRLIDHSIQASYDIIDLVGALYGLSYKQSLKRIYQDLRITDRPDLLPMQRRLVGYATGGVKSEIGVVVQPYTEEDAEYLSKRGITREIARYFQIHSLSLVQLNRGEGFKTVYHYKKGDPALGFFLGEKNGTQKWKVYFYKRGKDSTRLRFMSNTNRMSGYAQLPEKGDLLVMTKSMKDVACLYSCGITAVSMQGEGHVPYPEIAEELQSRFTRIVSLYDFDPAGVRTANIMRKRYGWPALLLTNGRFGTKDFGAKDFSDYYVKFGRKSAIELVNQTLEFLNTLDFSFEPAPNHRMPGVSDQGHDVSSATTEVLAQERPEAS